MHKIVYITVKAPFGRLGETYILPEMLALHKSGVDLLIVPRNKSKELYHESAEPLRNVTLKIPLFNGEIAKELSKYIIMHPVLILKMIKKIILGARSFRIAMKNLVILPKGIYISKILQWQSVTHIHAHYGSTTSTMAYIISEISGIPWSFTVHRWDITENNLLKIKCESASFVRAIDKQGRKEVIDIVNDSSLNGKISVIHVGVDIPGSSANGKVTPKVFTFLCPAVFVPKKGHQYLFQACHILSKKKDMIFKCLIAGDGPLKKKLKNIVGDLGLLEYIEFLGALSQDELYELYSNGRVSAVVLPSIVTESSEKEGIPVALMEAMSYGLPVISTDTGGIPELLDNNCGVMIREKDPKAIAEAMEKIMNDREYYRMLGQRGRHKVETEFNVLEVSRVLLEYFNNNY